MSVCTCIYVCMLCADVRDDVEAQGKRGAQANNTNMDTLGIEPRASRMLSGCDTTTPCALCEVFRLTFYCDEPPDNIVMSPSKGDKAECIHRTHCNLLTAHRALQTAHWTLHTACCTLYTARSKRPDGTTVSSARSSDTYGHTGD